MGTPMILKIILPDGSAQRLTLTNGLPASLDDLLTEVKNQCGLVNSFKLQFKDSLLGEEFMNLTSLSEVEDRGTLKVIKADIILHVFPEGTVPFCAPESSSQSDWPSDLSSAPEVSFHSDRSVDTDILSSPESSSSRSTSESSSSRSSWPAVFHVPKFSYDSEIILEKAGSDYSQNGTTHYPDPALRKSIIDGLVEEIVHYKVYVRDKEMEQVCQSLVKKHPCLTEKGSSTGYGGWKMSLKHRLANYRRKLSKLGVPEVTVNSLKNKPTGKCSAAYGVKKPKRAEVHFCPDYPSEETAESLEGMRKALLLDVKKRNNKEEVKVKMEKTFAHRRHEVVRDAPMVEEFSARWPALFDISEINAEFKRITTTPLQSKFLSKLDGHSDNLSTLFQKRGGKMGEKLKEIMAPVTDSVGVDVDVRRECILKALTTYMGEDPQCLVQEYVDLDENATNEAIQRTTLGVYVIKDASREGKDVGIVLESNKVLQGLDSVQSAIALLFGLIYALNLSYPASLRYTFEVIQKIFMELDGSKLSNKALALKNRLFQ